VRPETENQATTGGGCDPILVLGLGNILLRDEGVGVRVVQAMAAAALPPGIEVFDGATAGVDLVDVLADRRKVVVIDAMDGEDAPGTVRRLAPEDLAPRCDGGLSLHEVGLMEALTLARHMGRLPAEVVIFGIKPEVVEPGLKLSPRLSALVPRIVELVLEEVGSTIGPDGSASPPSLR